MRLKNVFNYSSLFFFLKLDGNLTVNLIIILSYTFVLPGRKVLEFFTHSSRLSDDKALLAFSGFSTMHSFTSKIMVEKAAESSSDNNVFCDKNDNTLEPVDHDAKESQLTYKK